MINLTGLELFLIVLVVLLWVIGAALLHPANKEHFGRELTRTEAVIHALFWPFIGIVAIVFHGDEDE